VQSPDEGGLVFFGYWRYYVVYCEYCHTRKYYQMQPDLGYNQVRFEQCDLGTPYWYTLVLRKPLRRSARLAAKRAYHSD
jgi:hypothetical protein